MEPRRYGETSGPEVRNLPFQEAINSFRSKLNVHSEHYTDVLHEMHARAFMVAGANQDAILTGFREAIDKAIAKGTTLAEFRDDFDSIVEKTGWSYRGTPGWRSKVIFETNLNTTYMAGAWEEAQRNKKFRPYGRYVAVQDSRTRKEHQAWHNWIVPLDDPWWDTHWPPNGWGCRCWVETVSDYDLRRNKETVTSPEPDKPYPVKLRSPNGDVEVQTVAGIDPGWAYNPGKANSGRLVSWGAKRAMEDAKVWQQWTHLTPGDWQSAKRPPVVPVDKPRAGLAPTAADVQASERILLNVLGGSEKIFTDPAGGSVLFKASFLAEHVDLDRSPFFPLLPEMIKDPYEIWLTLDKHKITGRVELRKRYIKRFLLPGDRAMYLVAQVVGGQFEGWTLVPLDKAARIRHQRVGKLLWGRKIDPET